MIAPLEVTDVHKHYDKFHAVKGVSFHVNRSEIFGLLGPNGAGKSTIINCLVTLEKPTSGTIRICGIDQQENSRTAKLRIGWVPQEPIQHGYFSAHEILQFQAGYYGVSKNDPHIESLLHSLSLYEHKDKKVRQLSGGMKRRLMIAKALVHKPDILLLDEPTAGVDIELREQLWQFVLELKKQGTSILLTTHYLEEAEMLCDRVAIIDHGVIKKTGHTKELIADMTTRKVKLNLVGQEKSHEFLWPRDVNFCDLLANQKLDPAKVSNISVIEGSLADAFKNVLSTKENV